MLKQKNYLKIRIYSLVNKLCKYYGRLQQFGHPVLTVIIRTMFDVYNFKQPQSWNIIYSR